MIQLRPEAELGAARRDRGVGRVCRLSVSAVLCGVFCWLGV